MPFAEVQNLLDRPGHWADTTVLRMQPEPDAEPRHPFAGSPDAEPKPEPQPQPFPQSHMRPKTIIRALLAVLVLSSLHLLVL